MYVLDYYQTPINALCICGGTEPLSSKREQRLSSVNSLLLGGRPCRHNTIYVVFGTLWQVYCTINTYF